MTISYIRDPEDPDAVFIIQGDTEGWLQDFEVHTLEARLRSFSLNDFFRARAEVQAELEEQAATVDEVAHRLATHYDVVQILQSSEGFKEFSELPLAIQLFLLGKVQRLLLGAVDLPFRQASGSETHQEKPRSRRKRT